MDKTDSKIKKFTTEMNKMDKGEPVSDAERAKFCETHVIAYNTAISQGYMRMAELLYEVNSKKHYKVLGYDTFETWIGIPEISMPRSTAYELIQAYELFIIKMGLQIDDIKVEISKIRMLNRLESKGAISTPEQAKEWLNKAEALSCSDLKAEINEASGTPEAQEKHEKRTDCEPAWHILQMRLQGINKASWLITGEQQVKCHCGKIMDKDNATETLLTGHHYTLQAYECDKCKKTFLIMHVFEQIQQASVIEVKPQKQAVKSTEQGISEEEKKIIDNTTPDSIAKSKGKEFEKAWADFIEMRKKIRRPMTTRGKELILVKLNKLSKDNQTQVKVLEQSIERSWQGVFELKRDTGRKEDISPKDKQEYIDQEKGDDHI